MPLAPSRSKELAFHTRGRPPGYQSLRRRFSSRLRDELCPPIPDFGNSLQKGCADEPNSELQKRVTPVGRTGFEKELRIVSQQTRGKGRGTLDEPHGWQRG